MRHPTGLALGGIHAGHAVHADHRQLAGLDHDNK